MIEQFCRDLNAAHDEIVKLQGGDPAKFDWPEWSGPANSIRWAERLTGKPLSKTALRAVAAPPPQTELQGVQIIKDAMKKALKRAIHEGEPVTVRAVKSWLDELDSIVPPAAPPPPQAWQPIETVPQDRRWVLVWNEDWDYAVYRFGPGLIDAEEPQPTHWMPLPDPPVAAPPPQEEP